MSYVNYDSKNGDLSFDVVALGSTLITVRKTDGGNLCSVAVSSDAPWPPFAFSSCMEADSPPDLVWLPDNDPITVDRPALGGVGMRVVLSPRTRHHPCNHDPSHMGVDPFDTVSFLGETGDEHEMTSSWELHGSAVTIEIVVVLKDSGGK